MASVGLGRQGLHGKGSVACGASGGPFNFRKSGRPSHSEATHREVVLFLAQRELESAFQRLVNMEMYEEARQVASQQEKLQEIVDEEDLSSGSEESGGGLFSSKKAKAPKSEPKQSDGDVVAKLLQLRTDLQRAIDSEDYKRASVVRDQILAIEAEMDKQRASRPLVKREPKYSLGQCVVHWQDGWTGVVCGMQQDEQDLKRKTPEGSQVSKEVVYKYHVLPDVRYWPKKRNMGPCVSLVEEGDLNAPQPPATWRSVHGSDPENFLISHPYMYLMFYGQDGEGNYVPSKKLRDKFNKQRKDVYWNDGSSDNNNNNNNNNDGKNN